MDNIQKLIVGVLGISGLLAMLTPSSAPFAEKSEAVALPVTAPELSSTSEGDAPPIDEFAEEESIDDTDDFAIGEPAIDGNPIGVSSQPNETPVADYGQLGNYGAGNIAPQAFEPQQNSAPPPPGTLMPTNNGQ